MSTLLILPSSVCRHQNVFSEFIHLFMDCFRSVSFSWCLIDPLNKKVLRMWEMYVFELTHIACVGGYLYLLSFNGAMSKNGNHLPHFFFGGGGNRVTKKDPP